MYVQYTTALLAFSVVATTNPVISSVVAIANASFIFASSVYND